MTTPYFTRRWDPFRDLREVGRLFETLNPPTTPRAARPYPPINLADGGDRYTLTAQLPGMAAEALDLSIAGETLTLRGERGRPQGVAEEGYRRQERPFGRWSRTIILPDRVDGSAITAELADGVLTVVVPKAEDSRPRQIVVTAHNNGNTQNFVLADSARGVQP